MSIVLQGSTSGSVTLQEPAIAGTTVLDLPAVSGTVLTTGSSGQSIPKAALPTGSVLQVVQTVKTNTFSTASTSFVDVTGLSVSITPTSATSKILVLMDVKLGSDTNVSGYLKILRDSTSIYIGDADGSCQRATYANSDDPSAQWPYQAVGNYLDSPATTSSITYKIQILSEPIENTGTVYINRGGDSSTTAAGGRTASSITVMEIAA
jgi:hypothetical protein